MTLFDAVGGEAFFAGLTDRFYDGVADDPLLRRLYPEDLTAPRRWLMLFLVQYWGGPGTYSEIRGHPRLRARHMPFTIGIAERDRWIHHMRSAVEASGAAPDEQAQLLAYFDDAANFLVNG